MIRKQNGMTLLEVLVTLLISSLLIMLVWTTIAITMKYNIVETEKLHMQQEVNYIITDLQSIHRKYDCYKVEEKDEKWNIIDCVSNKIITIYSSSDLSIELHNQPHIIYTNKKLAKTNNEKYIASYKLTVEVSKKDGKGSLLRVETNISRFNEERK